MQQARPLYLKSNYGKLKKSEVYVRRGSSTDPTKPAGPDEIALMGNASGPQVAELAVEFADVERDDSLVITSDGMPSSARCLQKNRFQISRSRVLGILSGSIYLQCSSVRSTVKMRTISGSWRITNLRKRLFRAVRIVVKNVGQVAANSVRVELSSSTDVGLKVADRRDLPYPPKCRSYHLGIPNMGSIRPAFRRDPGEVVIEKNDERFGSRSIAGASSRADGCGQMFSTSVRVLAAT